MKKYLLIFIMPILFGFISCKSDDSTSEEKEVVVDPDKAIIGTWNIYNIETCRYGTTTSKASSGKLIIERDGTFTMTGDVIRGLISYFDDREFAEVKGTYSFLNHKHFNFHVDSNTYPNMSPYLNLPTVFNENGTSMNIRREWDNGYELLQFKK